MIEKTNTTVNSNIPLLRRLLAAFLIGGGLLSFAFNATAQLDDILVIKQSDPPNVIVPAGENLTYIVEIQNNGAGTVTNINIADGIPVNTTFVSAIAFPPAFLTNTPPPGGIGVVEANIPSLNSGDSAFLEIVVNVNANTADGVSIINTATAFGNFIDPTPSDNISTTTNIVSTEADLSIVKTDSPNPVQAGANLTYTIEVENNGPSDAQNVSFSDAIPANTTFVSAVQNIGPAFSLFTPPVGGTGNVIGYIPTLPAGQDAVFTIVVNVVPATPNGTTIINTATVVSTTFDPVPTDNVTTVTTLVTARANLIALKTNTPNPIPAGDNLTYNIEIENTGPSDALNVTISDPLPPLTTFVSAQVVAGPPFVLATPPVGGTGTVSGFTPVLHPGVLSIIEIVVNVSPSAPDGNLVVNVADIESSSTDLVVSSTAVVINSADLLIIKNGSPDPVVAGDNLTYTIEIENNGPSDSQGVAFIDPLPANTTFESIVQNVGPAFTLSAPPVGGTGTVSGFIGTMPAGSQAIFTVVVNVNASTPTGTTLVNTATVGAVTFDPDTTDNISTVTTTVIEQEQLVIIKTDTPDPVVAGENLSYVIFILNNGPSQADNVVVSDNIPAGTTFVSATQNTGPGFVLNTPPVGGTGLVTATRPTFDAGAAASFTIVVKVDPSTADGTIIDNTAVLTATSPFSSHESSTQTLVITSADLAIQKLAPVQAAVGGNLTFILVVTNLGPSDSQTVTFADATPANTTFVAASQLNGPAFSLNTPPVGGTGIVSGSIATLPAGASATFSITVNINPGTPLETVIINVAEVSSAVTPDPNLSNNVAVTETEVVQSLATSDLSIVKTRPCGTIATGSTLTYTIEVTNLGPNDAPDVLVTDFLPDGFAFVSASGVDWTINVNGQTVTATNPFIASGATSVFTITGVVDATPRTLINIAEVSSPNVDPNPTNNVTFDETITVDQSAISSAILNKYCPCPIVD